MSCNQSGFCAFGNSWWWIIILLLIFGESVGTQRADVGIGPYNEARQKTGSPG